MPSWPQHAIWWHVYPLGFVGAERRASDGPAQPVHRLRRLEAWLDYLVELGCNGLALGPVFASETHGYDTVDHLRIDPRLGDDADFDALVAVAHERGIRVLLDGVFNHVGRGFGRFQQALAEGPGSEAAGWFHLRWPDGGGDDVHGGGGESGHGGGGGSGQPEVDVFEGHGHLVALDHASPAVADHVATVMDHWLARGADGWRLDAAYAVPADFWARVLPRVRERHPDAWFVGEVIHGDYAGYVRASTLDSVTEYELWKATWSALNDVNLHELAWTLGRHDDFARSFLPLTFVGNHDVTRIASRLDDRRHLGHALAVLFTVAGSPSVYAGDERAFTGVKEDREGGDDAVRPPFPESPDELSSAGAPVLRTHRELIALRRRHAWLATGRAEVLHADNPALAVGFSPTDGQDGGARLVLLLNVGDAPYGFDVDHSGLSVLAASEPAPPADDPVHVPAHGWAVLG